MISLSIDISGFKIYQGDDHSWKVASLVLCEGKSLNDLINQATIVWTDQDSGKLSKSSLLDELVYLDRISQAIRHHYREHIRKSS